MSDELVVLSVDPHNDVSKTGDEINELSEFAKAVLELGNDILQAANEGRLERRPGLGREPLSGCGARRGGRG